MKNQQRGLFGKSDSVLHKLFWDSFWVMLASELSVAVSRLTGEIKRLTQSLSLVKQMIGQEDEEKSGNESKGNKEEEDARK